MSCSRRARIPGASYFFTVALADRGARVLTEQIGALREAYGQCYQARPFFSDAIVVLPDHLHAVWTLPPGDADFASRWRQIKARFSRAVAAEQPASAASRKRGIWQRRFGAHAIRDQAEYRAHVAYCWGNPVKHGLVERAADWPFSSLHRDLRAGRGEAQWVGSELDGRFGE